MQNNISIKEDKYELLLKQLNIMVTADEPILTNLANVTAAIKQNIDDLSWVGFYLVKDGQLFLGPFQGKIACTKINFGEGVCGISAERKETIVVPDVHEFSGHIACDSESNSEIVLPMICKDKILGVLDLDSHSFSNFDQVDKGWLEKICNLLVNKLDLENFSIK